MRWFALLFGVGCWLLPVVAQAAPSPAPSVSPSPTPSPMSSAVPVTRPVVHIQSATVQTTSPVSPAVTQPVEQRVITDAPAASVAERDWAAMATGQADLRAPEPTKPSVLDDERGLLADAAVGATMTPASNERKSRVRQAVQTAGVVMKSQTVNDKVFAVLGLRAAGATPDDPDLQALAMTIVAKQQLDGGFSWNGQSTSETNTTSAVIQALQALTSNSATEQALQQAQQFLRATQNPDGGFPYSPGENSDSASTAWVIQALLALGDDLAGWRREMTPLEWLTRRIQPDGNVEYSAGDGSASASVLTNSYALLALRNKSLLPRPDPLPTQQIGPGLGLSYIGLQLNPANSIVHTLSYQSSSPSVAPAPSSTTKPQVVKRALLLTRSQTNDDVFGLASTSLSTTGFNNSSSQSVRDGGGGEPTLNGPSRRRLVFLMSGVFALGLLLLTFRRAED